MDDARTVTNAIISALRSGPIAHANLAPDGISYLALQVGEAMVSVSWYSDAEPCSGTVREVLVSGEGLPVSSRQVAEIVNAAQMRAKLVQKENLAMLAGRKPRDSDR